MKMSQKRKRSPSTVAPYKSRRTRSSFRRGNRPRLLKSRGKFNVHMYKRWAEPERIEFEGDGSSTVFGGSTSFSLTQLRGVADFTSLYDQYKIVCVVVKFQLLNIPEQSYGNSSDTNNTDSASRNSTQLYPKLWYYRDYDDATAPATLDAVQQVGKAKCITMVPNKSYSFKIRPAITRTIQGASSEPAWPKRLDCTDGTIVHFGFKYMLDTMGQITPDGKFWKIQMDKLYYLKFYNSR